MILFDKQVKIGFQPLSLNSLKTTLMVITKTMFERCFLYCT